MKSSQDNDGAVLAFLREMDGIPTPGLSIAAAQWARNRGLDDPIIIKRLIRLAFLVRENRPRIARYIPFDPDSRDVADFFMSQAIHNTDILF